MFKVIPAWLTPDGRKVPLLDEWKGKASSDPEQIRLWQELYRERLRFWAVPTGEVNDILVLDVDLKQDENGFKTLQEKNLYIPPTLFQRTLNGGMHFVFKYPKDGKHYGNKVDLLFKNSGLDVRGQGGYIFWYGIDAVLTTPIADAPTWLLELTQKEIYQHQGPVVKVSPGIAEGIVQTSLDAIREAPPGESNNTLNVEAFKLGQLVASESITREYAEQALFKAAKDRGKPDYEARATIASGLDGGMKKPLTSPFGETPVVAHIPMLQPPPPRGRWTPNRLTKYDLMNMSKLRKPQLFQDWSTEDIHLTTADGGTGKTTLKLFEAVCLALGERFLGFDCKQAGKTLFITGEDTAEKLAAILGAIVRQMGIIDNAEKVQTILDSIIIKKDADLCLIHKDKATGFLHVNPEALIKVMEAVDDVKPKLIVFDPISSFWGSESMLNDMNKAVTRFMSELVERSGACVEMINHMGKQSSANKDMSQFAGRGGSGLVSNSRVSRVLRQLFDDEYAEMTGETLAEKQTAMLCVVNKFSDGSPLYNKPFVIVRDGYLFSRKTLTPQKAMEAEKEMSDQERVFSFIKEERRLNRYPTRGIVISHFMIQSNSISEARVKRALELLQYQGIMGEKIKQVDNPDLSIRDRVYVISDLDGQET